MPESKKYTIRATVKEDVNDLKSIWKECFGDSDEYINLYFNTMYKNGSAVAAVGEDGRLYGSMYVIDGGVISYKAEKELKCGYLYALGTINELRGQGIGAKVTLAAAELAFSMGYDIALTCPASESLFDYYKNLGFSDFSWISRSEKDIQSVHVNSGDINRIDAYTYTKRRNGILSQNAVRYPKEYIEFTEKLLRMSGGGFYEITTSQGQVSIAAAEIFNGALNIKELLSGDEKIAECLANYLSCTKVFFSEPVSDEKNKNLQTLVIFSDGIENLNNTYFPFVLD